mmetsp:Transcript_6654/g.14525  ORF Transcript_6654/g.14525 Transcript_6654/m.14525 type:complete len:255 (-) Transcript_6654:248-1012(-)
MHLQGAGLRASEAPPPLRASRRANSGGSEVVAVESASIDAQESVDEKEDEDSRLFAHAASRVDHIITTATDRLVETPVDREKDVVLLHVEDDREVHPSGPRAAKVGAKRPPPPAARRVAPTASSSSSTARGLEIAAKLSERPQGPCEHVARNDFYRMPAGLQQVATELDEEQRYIASLSQPQEDGPKVRVRLLESGEKELLIRGLKLRFQQTTASCLQAGPKGKRRAALEAELEQIKQDIDNLNRPYIFVEASQ